MPQLSNLMYMLLVLPFTSQGFEQFEVLGIESGLSQNTVRVSIQDKKRFIWFGTDDGLNRFDGNRIITFRHQPQNPYSISYDKVNDLALGPEGNLWVATGNGLNQWNNQERPFLRFFHPDAKNLTSLALTGDASFWITTVDHGVLVFDPLKQQYISDPHLKHLSALANYNLTSIAIDNKNRAWFGTKSSGFYIYDFNSKTLDAFDNTGSISNIGGDFDVRDITADQNGNIWVATFDHGLFRYRSTDPMLTPQHILPEKSVYKALVDHHKNIWVGTYQHGLYKFDENGSNPHQIQYQNSISESLPSNNVFNLMQDHSRQLWLGTDGGAAKLNIEGQRFGHQNINLKHPSEYNQNLIMRALEDEAGQIWIGTFGGGLIRFNLLTGDYETITGGDDQSLLRGDFVIGLAEADDGLWIGASTGLYFLNNKDSSLIQYRIKGDDGPFEDSNVHAVHVDTHGNLWVGTYQSGIYLKKKHSDLFINFINISNDPSSLSNDSVNHFIEPIPGQVWALTENGVNRYDDTKQNFKQFFPAKTNNHIASAWVDNLSNIWLGTAEGIYIIDLAGNPVSKLDITDGLSNNTIVGILGDDNQNVWISTNNGLNKYNLITKEVTDYYRKDGLQSNEFNIAYTKLSDGRLLFGGVNGFNLFDPGDIKTDDTLAKPVITSIEPIGPTSNGPDFATQIQPTNQTVNLMPQYYGLDIYFTGLHYKAPDKNRYRYMLEGLDSDWFMAEGADNSVRYTNLNPGTYVFKLQAYNSDGILNQNAAALTIHVLPPWWKTRIAYVSYAVTFLLLTYLTYRWRTKSLRAYTRKLESEVKAGIEEKEKFFENASHEFRTPLTMILKVFKRLHLGLTSFEFNRQLEAGTRNAHRLWRYANQLLDLSVISSGHLQLQLATYYLAKQVQQVSDMFLPEIKDKNLELKLELQEDLLVHYDEMAMEDILVNLISNAVKYTPDGGLVTISAYTGKRNKALIQIRDTGPGIPLDEQERIFDRFQRASNQHTSNGSGLGLTLVYQLVTAMGGTIDLESKLGEGCCFTLTFPLNRKITTEPQPLRDSRGQSYLLPARTQHTKAKAPNDHTIEVSSSTTRPLLLVIDDEPDILDHFVEVLNEYELITTTNGKTGFDLAKKSLPDLIVSDVMMEKMDGIELSRKIRNNSHTSHIPIILVTAKGDRDSKIEGLSEGVNDFITKPFDEQELLLKISNLIAVRKTYAEKYLKQGGHIQPDSQMPPADRLFIEKLNAVIAKNYHDPNFNVNSMADELFISTRQLERKMEGAFSQKPSDYLRKYRLEKSKRKLDKENSISKTSDACGFRELSTFSRCFKAAFGITPSEYQKRNSRH